MTKKELPGIGGQTFENLKQINDHGAEYWSARDLQPLLGYSQWRRFEDAVKRAQASCEQSANDPAYHFAGAGKMIGVGKGGQREVDDYQLSRFACYLIAQNGDPRKPEIAQAQKYFAIQTRRQELSEQLAADVERLELRKQTSEEFKALSGAAQQAGVQHRMFGIFHDAGYKGLYGGLGNEQIKVRKGVPAKEQLMDRMNATELAANQFRMTQARDKLAREGIRDPVHTSRSARKSAPPSNALAANAPRTFPPPNPSRTLRNASRPPRPGWNWTSAMRVACWETAHPTREQTHNRHAAFLVCEARGAKENAELELEFRRIRDGRNIFNKPLPFELAVADKKTNSEGMQLADLTAGRAP